MTQESKAYQRTIKRRKEVDLSPQSPQEADKQHRSDRLKRAQEWTTVEEKIAASSVYTKNWYPKEMSVRYPYDDMMKRVDKYFPYAKPKPLLIDNVEMVEGMTPEDREAVFAKFENKAAQLKKLGYRYAYIEHDDKVDIVLKQLGEF